MSPILDAKDIRGVSAELWARKFSRELIVFTHKQWTYRNGVVHFSPSENTTVSEHEAIDEQLQSLLSLSPSDLLPHHRHLLTAENFTDLAAGTSVEKLYYGWRKSNQP
jgi:mRNA degradation ribonuclease J1/J2